MKRIEAIIQPYKLEEVKHALNDVGIQGMTVIEVRGYGRQLGHTEIFRDSEYCINCLPKVKLEMVVSDELAKPAVAAVIASAKTGHIGDGKIFVSAAELAVRIRTSETGERAVR